jgi:hypothetical protein
MEANLQEISPYRTTGTAVRNFRLRVSCLPLSICSHHVNVLYIPWSSANGVPFFQWKKWYVIWNKYLMRQQKWKKNSGWWQIKKLPNCNLTQLRKYKYNSTVYEPSKLSMLQDIVSLSTNACIKSKLYPNITFGLLILQMETNNNKKHNAHGATFGVPVTPH